MMGSTTADAMCGACLPGFTQQGTACVAMNVTCAQIQAQCDAINKNCVQGATTATCTGCKSGFPVDDMTTGSCRAAYTCATLVPACTASQTCMAGTPTTDATCQSRNCPACTNASAGEDGVWPASTLAGRCICKTLPGFFYTESGSIGIFPCDADGDGWVRESARFALQSADPAVVANARCALRTVNRVTLENEAGQTQMIPVSPDLPLYESVPNDDQNVLNQSTPPPPFYGPTGRALLAKERNSLTKACVSQTADHNENKLPDVEEWGRPPNQQSSLNGLGLGALQPFFEVYTRFSYYVELHRGWYEPPTSGAVGSYRIREKSRRVPGDGLPVAYALERDGGAWTSEFVNYCERGRDRWYSDLLPAQGMDYASVSAPNAQGWGGMMHHSQYKCVALDPSRHAVLAQTDGGLAAARAIQTETTVINLDWQMNACVASPGANPVSRVPVAGTANPWDPVVSCTPIVSAGSSDVVWAAARIMEPENYERGCIKLCGGQRFLCPGNPPDGGTKPPCYTMCGDFAASEVKTLGVDGGYRLRGEVPYVPFSGMLGNPDGGGFVIRPTPTKPL